MSETKRDDAPQATQTYALDAPPKLAKRWSFWAIQLVAWSAYGLLTYLSDLPSLAEAQMFSMLGVKLVRAALGMGLSLLLYVLYRDVMMRRASIAAIGGVAVVASLGASVVWHIVYDIVSAPAGSGFPPPLDWGKFRMSHPEYAFVMLAWSAAYLGIEFWRYSRVQERRALEARALAREAQLESLSYQLNPHFLFNSLNSIRALVQEDQGKARAMVTQLSEFLRHTLVSAPTEEVPLSDEVEVLGRYLDIERTRFDDRLSVTIDVDPDVAQVPVPSLILHPLVENAIKHGMRTSPAPLQVRIEARREDGDLRIEVANTGTLEGMENGSEDPDNTGIGLRNVSERLAQLYPGRHSMQVVQDGDWVRAIIQLEGAG
jgi:signal transduction histidine kinase